VAEMASSATPMQAKASTDEFVPPFPYRWPKGLTPWHRIWLARKNLLATFEEAAFELDFASIKILTKQIILCNSPETVQYAFSIRNDNFERKSSTMRHMLEPLIGDGLFISEGETWRKRRRIVSPIVHSTRLGEIAPVMTETVRDMGERWTLLPEGTMIDALAEMAQLTAEIICRSIFGRELGRERSREVVEGFSDFQRAVSRIDFLSLLGLPDWLPRPRRLSMYRAVGRIHRVIDDIIMGYRGRVASEHVSLIGRLIDARDPDTGEALDLTAVRNEAVVIFMAGHETTANTLAFVWFLLSQSPHAEARLHHEIDSVLGDRLPSLADVPKLSYTRAIIEETLRLYPPIPVLAREAIQDETVGGYRIRKGSIIAVVPWLLHRKRKLWDKPDHFIPERFLDETGPPPDKWTYVPFSIGPRVCPGMTFGLTEAILCVAMLARRFRLRLQAGHEVRPICRVSLRPGDMLPMTLHRRHSGVSQDAAAPSASTQTCPFGHG
jgi:cytochrome P450